MGHKTKIILLVIYLKTFTIKVIKIKMDLADDVIAFEEEIELNSGVLFRIKNVRS